MSTVQRCCNFRGDTASQIIFVFDRFIYKVYTSSKNYYLASPRVEPGKFSVLIVELHTANIAACASVDNSMNHTAIIISDCRPPRCMGDGFVVLQSSDIDIYYYQDEPGV